MELRPYQVEAIDAARARLREGAKRVLVIIPTGGGKTVLAAEIIRSAVAKGSRILFLAHRRELITQTADKLTRFGVRFGIIMPGWPRALHHQVQVASVQTLIRHPELLQQVDLVFVDEAHHASAESYQKLLGWWPSAKVVGLTATPWRQDGEGLADLFDAHVIGCTPRQLRDEGFLCPVGGWEYEAVDTTGVRVRGGDFAQQDLARAARSTTVMGDVVTEWMVGAGGARTVLFAINVEHSQHLVEAFKHEGVAAEHVDGEMPVEERDAVLARFREGRTLVVSNCNVLTEGWDCPEAEVAVLCRPTLSTSLYLQMVGRVLRPAPGKERARIHDHAGCLRAHGHPYEDRDYSPEHSSGGSRREAQEREATVKRCPHCKSVLARWPCDGCGYRPTQAELQVQYRMEEARKREIGNDPSAPEPQDADEAERQRRWRVEFEPNEGLRRGVFFKWCKAKGVTPAIRTYRFFSGRLARPPDEWIAEARAREARNGGRAA
jgi:DNA repair protein RadD